MTDEAKIHDQHNGALGFPIARAFLSALVAAWMFWRMM